jgi:branched-subunit amino acid permease
VDISSIGTHHTLHNKSKGFLKINNVVEVIDTSKLDVIIAMLAAFLAATVIIYLCNVPMFRQTWGWLIPALVALILACLIVKKLTKC